MARIETADFLTTSQVAEELEITPDTVKHHCQRGNLPAIKIGREWLISRKELSRYIETRRPVGRPKNT